MRPLALALALAPLLLAALPATAQPPPPRSAAPKPAGKTEVTWLGHAAFRIRTPSGKVLLVDPWLTNPKNAQGKQMVEKPGQVDAILVTHGHGDHVGDAIALGKATKAQLVTTFDLGKALVAAGYPKDQAQMTTQGNTGGTVSLLGGEVEVSFTPAVHSSAYEVAGKSGPDAIVDAGNPGGFLIRIRGGPSIYHAGDTDVFGDMERISPGSPPTLMLAPIGGHFTMDPPRAAEAVKLVNPRTVIPMHYGTFPILAGTPDALKAAMKKTGAKAEVQVLEVGKPYTP